MAENVEAITRHILAATPNMSPTSSSSSSTISAPYHIVPGILSPAFIGREAELRWLEDMLTPENENFAGMRVGIHGMTGVGKTQLMLKYEAKFGNRCYTTRIFLVASSRTKFIHSVQEVLETMGLPQWHTADPNVKIQGLHNWLSQSKGWLLLIDNAHYESVDLVRELLVTDAQGHVIITSQHKGAVEKITGSLKTCSSLEELGPNDAVDMFVAATGLDDDNSNRQVGTEVVNAMGLMPQAIEQAASYIRENAISPDDFLARYKQVPEQFLEWSDDYQTNPYNDIKDGTRRIAISKHFWLTYESLQNSNPDAWAVLRMYSLLEPESIPLFDEWRRPELDPGFAEIEDSPQSSRGKSQHLLRILTCCFAYKEKETSAISEKESSASHCSDSLADIFKDHFRLERAIATLCDLSLVRRVEDRRTLWMHDLTKKTVRSKIPPEDLGRWVRAAINVVFHMLPVADGSAQERAWVETCLPQATGLVQMARDQQADTREYACLLLLCALCNLHHGSWALSREQFETVKPIYDRYLGPENPRTLNILEYLAWANRHVGDMAVSEGYFKQAWKLREKVLGPDSPDTLRCLDALASTIERAGRLKEAEVMFLKLYKLHKEASGMEGVPTMVAAHNLAVCYFNQGRLSDAEGMYKMALEASEKYLGPEHRGTLKTLSNYAATLDHDGRCNEAKAAYDRALAPFVTVMGLDHQLTLRLRANMAGLLRQQGRFDASEAILESSLATVSKIFGDESFETIQFLYDRGETWHAKGDLERARDAFVDIMGRLVADMMQHPVVFRFIDSLGAVEKDMGHLDIAEEKSKEAYEKFEALLTWHDPYTLVAANDYAEVIQAQGRYQKAWDLLVRCRDSFESLVGNEHPHYAMVINNLGRLCWILGKDPMPFFEKARATFANRVGPGHFCALTVSLNIARTRFAAGNLELARTMVLDARADLQASIGATHPLVSACDIILGIMSASRGDEVSLLMAREHFRTAVETAQKTGYVASANYFLSICLLILVLRRLQSDSFIIDPLLQLVTPPVVKDLSQFDIPGVGKFSVAQLIEMDPAAFDFNAYIPLSIGECTRLRWGRKSCWREAEDVLLQG